jgi:Tol biopolymer transport system component
MAQPFDPSGLRTTGEMFPVAEQVWLGSGSIGFGAFSVAANGTLVYRTDKSAASRELVWVSRTGKRLAAATEPAAITSAYSLAPDGKTLAVTINVGGDPNSAGNADIWLQDVERGVRTRFTFRAGANLAPIWSPDGSRVAFSFLATGATGQYSETIYQQSAAGSGKEEPLLQAGQAADGVRSTDWSPDGKFIVYQRIGPKTAADLWLLPLEGERQPVPYLQTPFNEQNAQFSPGSAGGSRWMAYQSNESGQNQIFIRAIPASGAKYQVSTTGGTLARWRQDGKELFYLTADQKLIATPITLGANLQIGTPQELFTNAGMTSFVPSRDGQRFLVNVPATGGAAAAAPITVVTNWQAALKK